MNLLSLMVMQANPVERYLRFLLADDPFRGLYALTAFDLLLVVPYFAILGVLSFYGLHRFRMVYLYHRYRRNQPSTAEPPAEADWPRQWRGWPDVTIQLPVYNEKYVVERLIDAVAAMDYPRDRLEIQVLDDSTDDTLRSATCTGGSGRGTRPGRWPPDSSRPGASSWPSSTPIFCHRRIFCAGPFPTLLSPGWAWCRRAGPT
jgi:hypothetical protein